MVIPCTLTLHGMHEAGATPLYAFFRPAMYTECGGCRCIDQPVELFCTGPSPAISQAASRNLTSPTSSKLQSSAATPWPPLRPHCLAQCQLYAIHRFTWERLAPPQRLSSRLPGSHLLLHLMRAPYGEQAALGSPEIFFRS